MNSQIEAPQCLALLRGEIAEKHVKATAIAMGKPISGRYLKCEGSLREVQHLKLGCLLAAAEKLHQSACKRFCPKP